MQPSHMKRGILQGFYYFRRVRKMSWIWETLLLRLALHIRAMNLSDRNGLVIYEPAVGGGRI